MYLLDGSFKEHVPIPFMEWTHVAMNYIGPEDGLGMRVYYDGTLTGNITTKDSYTYPAGEGRIFIGRYFVDIDQFGYGSFDMDELLFFNETINEQEIMAVKNLV